MSDYLARLKTIEKEKIFCNTLITEVPKVPKVPKVPFDTFDTSTQAQIEKKNINCSDLKREQRRQKVLKILADQPGIQRALLTNTEADPQHVIVTIAIRDQYSFEMTITREKYDAFLLLELINKGSMQ